MVLPTRRRTNMLEAPDNTALAAAVSRSRNSARLLALPASTTALTAPPGYPPQMQHRRRTLIHLDWERDAAGYELLPEETKDHPVHGITESLLGAASALPMRVMPRGGKLLSYRPRDLELYTRFASIHSPEDVLDFINKHGLLTRLSSAPGIGEIIPDVLDHAAAFRSFLSYDEERAGELALWAGPEGKRLGQLNLSLAQDTTSGALCIQLRPPTLLAGLYLQLGQKLSGNRPFQDCRYCNNWFETGPGTGRRLDAMFCTDEHRVLFNSRKRANKGKST